MTTDPTGHPTPEPDPADLRHVAAKARAEVRRTRVENARLRERAAATTEAHQQLAGAVETIAATIRPRTWANPTGTTLVDVAERLRRALAATAPPAAPSEPVAADQGMVREAGEVPGRSWSLQARRLDNGRIEVRAKLGDYLEIHQEVPLDGQVVGIAKLPLPAHASCGCEDADRTYDELAGELVETQAKCDRLRRVNGEWGLVMSTLIDGLAERGVPTPLGGTYTQAALDEIDRLRSARTDEHLQALCARFDEAQQEAERMRQGNLKLSEELTAALADDQAERELAEARQEAERLRVELDETRKDRNRLIAALGKANGQLRADLAEARQEAERLRGEVGKIVKDIDDLNGAVRWHIIVRDLRALASTGGNDTTAGAGGSDDE